MIRATLSALLVLAMLALAACAAPDGGADRPSDTPAAAGLRHVSATPPAQAGHAQHAPALAADAPLADTSLFHLSDVWRSHRGDEVVLADYRGRPTVVVMLYANCETACPILIRDALRLEETLPTGIAERVQFVMVTIDPERDAPETLAAYVDEHDLDAPNWHFLSGSPNQTRALAALLGVQYRAAGNGMFSHSNLVTVLDAEGVVAVRTEGLGQPVQPAADAIAGMLAR